MLVARFVHVCVRARVIVLEEITDGITLDSSLRVTADFDWVILHSKQEIDETYQGSIVLLIFWVAWAVENIMHSLELSATLVSVLNLPDEVSRGKLEDLPDGVRDYEDYNIHLCIGY